MVEKHPMLVAASESTTTEFFEALYPDLDGGLIEILKLPGRKQKWCTTIEEAAEAAKDDSCNIFFGVATRFDRKGDKAHVAQLPAYWVDVDVEETNERGRCWKTIESFEHSPSVIVETRRGWHLYWLLREPEDLSVEDIPRAEGLMFGLARELGGDQCWDVSRRLRVPNTFHAKDGNGNLCGVSECPSLFKATIVVWNPEQRYNPDDFEHYCLEAPSQSVAVVDLDEVRTDLLRTHSMGALNASPLAQQL